MDADGKPKETLTEDDLKRLKNHLALLSGQHVEEFYHSAHRECCLHDGKLPAPRAIQQLVTAWKLLRGWAARRR